MKQTLLFILLFLSSLQGVSQEVVITEPSNTSYCGSSLGLEFQTLTSGLALPFTSCTWTRDGEIFWNDCDVAPTQDFIDEGTYEICVTVLDANAISAESCKTIQILPPQFTITSLNVVPTCVGVENGSITLEISNPSVQYDYSWSNGAGNTPFVENLAKGAYTVTVSIPSSNNCNPLVQEFLVEEMLVLSGNTEAEFCPGGTTTLYLDQHLPAEPSYWWSNGENGNPQIEVTEAGVYTVTVSTETGCTATLEYVVQQATGCVWPGDANYDGVANNKDIVVLGYAHDDIGQARSMVSNDWVGQLAPFDWGNTTNGTNHKHADCNGDGIVDLNDTLAIYQNYGLPPHEFREMDNNSDFDLSMEFDVTSANYGEYVNIEVKIGNELQPVDKLYGLAFSIHFNYPEVVKESSIVVDYSNSVFGEDNNIRMHRSQLEQAGRIDFAITKYDHSPIIDVNGTVLTLRIIIEDNIDGFTSTDYDLMTSFQDILCVEEQGTEILLNPIGDEMIMQGTNSIYNYEESLEHVKYYPNPIDHQLHIDFNTHASPKTIMVYDPLGRIILEQNGYDGPISTTSWNKGIYFLEIWDNRERRYLIKIIKE